MALQEIEQAGAPSSRTPADAETAKRLRTDRSSVIAKMLEYQLLGDLSAELLRRGRVLEVLRGDVDAFGHDIVLELDGIVRHVQLKSQYDGGTNTEVSCHEGLKMKPSGCVLWITYDPDTYRAVTYRCFGEPAGTPLLKTSGVVAKRSTPNGKGDRPERIQHRVIKRSVFRKMSEIADLAEWLFGDAANAPWAGESGIVSGSSIEHSPTTEIRTVGGAHAI